MCQNPRVRNVLQSRRFFVGCTCAVPLILIGFWISSLSHTTLAFYPGGAPCPPPKGGGTCVTVATPYWAPTWPSTTWMLVICIILFGVWIAASKWLFQRLVSSQIQT
jgi:hypothetical protein